MRLRYIFIPLLILAAAFFGLRYADQSNDGHATPSPIQPITPLSPSGSGETIVPTPPATVVSGITSPVVPKTAVGTSNTELPVATNSPATTLGCTRTKGTIDTNVLGIGQPSGLAMKDLPYLQDLGVKWVRTDLWWEYMEPKKGVYAWNELDGIARVLNENRIKLLFLFSYVPDWVWAKDKKGRQDAVYTFSKALATRYRGKIRYYEVFNEPNLPGIGFFKERDTVDVGIYLEFLAAANKGIHEADPNAVIVIGGLAPGGTCATSCKNGEIMGAFQFMKQLYELGGKDCFDVLAYHPYDTSVTFKEVAEQIRAGMIAYGDSAKPIWFNEFGTDDESQQLQTMNQRKDELSAVPANFWFSLHDNPTDTYGLLTADYQKRPAYDLFKQIIKSQQ